MKILEIKGAVVANDDKWIYDWLGMDAASPRDIAKGLAEASGDNVTIEINSGGGDVFAASEIFYLLQSYPSTVTADIVGFSGSAATIICCGANRVRAVPTAMYMIHNVSASAAGDYHVMHHQAEVLQTANKAIAAAYRQKTGLSEKELLALMDKESWMSADEALRKGFIDEIIGIEETDKGTSRLYNTASDILSPAAIDKIRNKLLNENQLKLLKLKGELRNHV